MKQFDTPTILFIIVFSIYFLCGCSSPDPVGYLSPSMRLAYSPPVKKVEDESPWGVSNAQFMKQMWGRFPNGRPWKGSYARPNPWLHSYRDDVYWSWNFK